MRVQKGRRINCSCKSILICNLPSVLLHWKLVETRRQPSPMNRTLKRLPTTRAIVFLLTVLLLATSLRSQAQTAAPGTTEEARKQFEAADAELNKVYRRCYDDLAERPAVQAVLRDAQRLWVECRDRTATAYAGAAPIQRLEDTYRLYAETAATQNRTKELEALFGSSGKTGR